MGLIDMKLFKMTLITIVILTSFFLLFLWFANGGKGYETIDIMDYRIFEEYNGESNLNIFPSLIPDNTISSDYIYHYRDGLAGDKYQIYLKLDLTRNDFLIEINRLKKIASDFDSSNYAYPAYEIDNQDDDVYEYALYDVTNFRIYYIYLERVPKRTLKFPKKLLPSSYSDLWW